MRSKDGLGLLRINNRKREGCPFPGSLLWNAEAIALQLSEGGFNTKKDHLGLIKPRQSFFNLNSVVQA